MVIRYFWNTVYWKKVLYVVKLKEAFMIYREICELIYIDK